MLCTRCVSERCRVDPQYLTSYVYSSYKRRLQRRRKHGSCGLIKTSKTTPTACRGALEKRDLEADHSCFLQSNRTKEHRHLCFQGTKILNINELGSGSPYAPNSFFHLHRKLKHIKSPQRRASGGNGKTPLVTPAHSAHKFGLRVLVIRREGARG